MQTYARYSWALVVLGILAAMTGAVLRLFDGDVTTRVQISIAVALVLLAGYLGLSAESLQKWGRGRQARYGANAVAMSLAFVSIVGIVNYLANDRFHTEWDLTENKRNTLSDQTFEVLRELPEPVKATAFISAQNVEFRDETDRLLQLYRDSSAGKFTFEIVDMDREPALAGQMGVTRDNTVVMVLGDRREEVQFGNEQEYTGALVRLAHPEERVVYFLAGHGEADVEDASEAGYGEIKAALERQNYTVETLNLVAASTVPNDAQAVIVAGPQVALTDAEVASLGTYLDGGGGAVFLLNPTVQMRETGAEGEEDPLVDWLNAAWGIQVENNIVYDLANTQPTVAVAQAYGQSPITDKLLSQQLTSLYPVARSISLGSDTEAAALNQVNPFVFTGANSWGETDFTVEPQPDEGEDQFGPLTLAVTAENLDTRARVVVFGDSDFAVNVNAMQFANSDMLVNSVNWVTGNNDLISISPRDSSVRPPLDPTNRTIVTLGLASVCLLPFGVLAAGVAVVWSRRVRYK